MTDRRSLMSSSGRFFWSAQWKIRPKVDSWVSFRPRTFDNRSGPNESIVARSGMPLPWPARAKNSAGYAVAAQSLSPVSAARSVIFSPGCPGTANPDRSPLMSGMKTGTPATESCSATPWSVLVLPVPVAPATRPCRLNVESGMRTSADGSQTPSTITAPTVTCGSDVSYPAPIRLVASVPAAAAGSMVPSPSVAGDDSADTLAAFSGVDTVPPAARPARALRWYSPRSVVSRTDHCRVAWRRLLGAQARFSADERPTCVDRLRDDRPRAGHRQADRDRCIGHRW